MATKPWFRQMNFYLFKWPNKTNLNKNCLIISIIFRFITYFYKTSLSRNHRFVPLDRFKFPLLEKTWQPCTYLKIFWLYPQAQRWVHLHTLCIVIHTSACFSSKILLLRKDGTVGKGFKEGNIPGPMQVHMPLFDIESSSTGKLSKNFGPK